MSRSPATTPPPRTPRRALVLLLAAMSAGGPANAGDLPMRSDADGAGDARRSHAMVAGGESAPSAPRYSGRATLAPPAQASADARYRVAAELLPGDRTQASGRFALDARLDASLTSKSAAAVTACTAGDHVFSDSFE